MLPIITVVIILIPFIEVAVLFLVADAIGWPIALALFVVVPVVGLLVLRQQGLTAMRRMQTTVRQEQLPAQSLVETMLFGLAGVLLVIPGFVTAFLGILLLIPPLRRLSAKGVIAGLRRRFERTPPVTVSVTTADMGVDAAVGSAEWATVVEPETLAPAHADEAGSAADPGPEAPSVHDTSFPPQPADWPSPPPFDAAEPAVDAAPPESGTAETWVEESAEESVDAAAETAVPKGEWTSFDSGRDWEDEPKGRFRIFRRKRRTE